MVLLNVVAQIVPVAVLLAAHAAGMLLLHVAAFQVHCARCGVLKACLALRTIVRLLRIVASVDVLQQELLQLVALLRAQTELAGIANGQLWGSRLIPDWFLHLLIILLLLLLLLLILLLLLRLVDVYGIHENLYGITGSVVWLCFG